MLRKRVEQKNLIKVEDYDGYWENQVLRIIEESYASGPDFKVSLQNNDKLVMGKIINKMKVIPIDLKETLYSFYKRMTPVLSPDDGPRRGVA